MNEKKVFNRTKKILHKYSGISKKEICFETSLKDDLGLSSFDIVSILPEFENEFSISLENSSSFESVHSVKDIVLLICQLTQN